MISPLYGQLSPLRIPTRAPRGPVTDSDALAYIAAVETADGQSLEDAVKFAYEDFIVGCKSDGIWSAIKASCILAGARTLSGALVPLVGSAATNNNFVSADYNRETGLKGNGSSKFISTGINNNAVPQNNFSAGVYITEAEAFVPGGKYLLGASIFSTSGTTSLFRRGVSPGNFAVRSRSTGLTELGIIGSSTGFFGTSRAQSSSFNSRANSTSNSHTQSSQSPNSDPFYVFRSGDAAGLSLARLSFYSIGESINLPLLDTRVSTLMTDLAAAI